MKRIVMLALLGTAMVCQGEDLTNHGRVYFDFALVTNRCTAEGIVFSHKAGVAKLDFMDMSEGNQARFGYDRERYEAFKAAQPPPPQAAASNPPAPEAVIREPAPQPRIVRKVTVVTNTASPTTFGSSPVTDIRPSNEQNNRMNEARLKAIQKQMEINNRAIRNQKANE